jgi:hypothetical protein
MAIQLSERDNLIFRFVDEHQVLLEKHIAWFISCDEKPVLIRDRLRKLFYLDYLLCERHGGKLPWWTTPTKPLVYMLSPMTRQLVKAGENQVDIMEAETQRHLLEVANIRMLYLMDQKEGTLSDLHWSTIRKADMATNGIDAMITFKRNGMEQRIGLLNHPSRLSAELNAVVAAAIAEHKLDTLCIVSRDEAHLAQLQAILSMSPMSAKISLTTHQEVYKSGMIKARWQGAVVQPVMATAPIMPVWGAGMTPAQAY